MKNNKKKTIPQFNKEICIACTMCVDICPVGVLELHIANSPHGFRRFPFLANADKCTGCLSCEKQCPSGAITMME
jgi:2-oxoglutarate ferredoxin oxidoreductase subunit delta